MTITLTARPIPANWSPPGNVYNYHEDFDLELETIHFLHYYTGARTTSRDWATVWADWHENGRSAEFGLQIEDGR